MTGLTVHGGAAGVGARLQDLRSEAGLLDGAGDDVRRWSGSVAAVALHPDVTVATLLCPAEVASVAVSVAGATIGADGLLVVSTGFEATALVLRASATTYELVDASAQRVLDQLQTVAGFTLGAALPLLALGGGVLLVGGAGVALATPATWPALVLAARTTDLATLGDTAVRGLYDNPWLVDGLVRVAPGLLQGTTWSVGSMLGGPAGGFVLPFALSGGTWPSTSYEDAIGGLVNAGGLLGMFQDTGAVGVSRFEDGATGEAPRTVADVFREQYRLGQEAGTVQIVEVAQADGSSSWIVQIPGTQEWAVARGDNPVDLTTNVRLMAGEPTFMQAQVAQAMRDAGVAQGEPVMLTGHSQGGITAAALASDAAFRAEFDVRSVVTGGSPIARFDIPDSVSVLALEHDQDAVPMLEGRRNPDRPQWVTVGRSLPSTAFTVPDPLVGHTGVPVTIEPGVGAAHGTDVYADTGRAVDRSTDPSIRSWLDRQTPFFTGDAQVTRWDVTR